METAERASTETPAIGRPRLVRIADWIARHRYALFLIAAGMYALYHGIQPLIRNWISPPPVSYTAAFQTAYAAEQGASTSSVAEHGQFVSALTLSQRIIAGTGLLALGLMWMARRFSLRWLMAAVFITGVLGAVPFQVPDRPGAVAVISVRLPAPIDAKGLAEIHAKLAPENVLPTLPAGFRAMMNPAATAGIIKLEVEPWTGQPLLELPTPTKSGVTCRVEMNGEITPDERNAIISLYDWYTQYVVLRAAESRGILPEKSTVATLTSEPFSTFKKEWLVTLKKR
jgi:hypothetical protein